MVVNINVWDQYNNIATSEFYPVILVTNATAIVNLSGTTGGQVTINAGVGSRSIRSSTPGIVRLSLLDAVGPLIGSIDLNSTQLATFFPGLLLACCVFISGVHDDEEGICSVWFSLILSMGYMVCDSGAPKQPGATTSVVFASARQTGTVDGPIAVTILALDQFGNLATAEGRTVTVVLNGSATGGGVVTFINGTAVKYIRDSLPELVQLSLFDSAGLGVAMSSSSYLQFGPGTVLERTHLTFRCNNVFGDH
jgi:hypothetical protein